MNKMSSKTLFMIMMFLSTMMVMSSSNMFLMWMGMEINLMAFMPMIMNKKNNSSTQSMILYFMAQSMSSMIMLLTLINTYIMNQYYLNTIISMCMLMKLGAPPFHMWMPDMMNNMPWYICVILMTWQKLAPMTMLSITMWKTNIMMFMIAASTIIGSVMGLNHTSIRKIMAYSSMSHLGWMMASEMMYKKSWIMYMFVYTIIIMMLAFMMNMNNIMFINQFYLNNMNTMEKLLLSMMMLSMGGLPPFLGFLPKWMVIQYMISSQEMILMLIMLMSALVTLIYYMRLISTSFMIMNNSQKWIFLHTNNKNTTMYLMYINMSLPLMVMLMYMF